MQPLAAVRATLPPGYRIEVGGAVGESAKGQASIFAVLPVMLLTMLVILMLQLQSVQKLVLVMLTAPLGLIGVSLALLASDQPFGFVAMLGTFALTGMIIRNSVVLMAQIKENEDEGIERGEAIVEATMHRLRPILLTAAAAILGLIPIAGEVFWGPMAYAMMGGLLIATVLTLIFLPALYASLVSRAVAVRRARIRAGARARAGLIRYRSLLTQLWRMSNMFTDVLIVGAGPTGLMLANQLARRGIRPLIIDHHSGPAQQTRAMAVHARTMEIYSQLGIIEEAMELGQRGNGANMWAKGDLKARIPLASMGEGRSPFPYVLMLGQDDNERIMGAHLQELGVTIQWNTELLALEQSADHVTATIKHADGSTRTVTAAYVAGCDGARSAVRELNGIAFPGAPYEQVFFVADTEATGPMVAKELNIYLWRSGFHLFFPMRGRDRWRVIGILPAELRDRDDLTFEELVPALRMEASSRLQFKSCSWFSTYRIHHRRTERFMKGRCFLLGDAAHIHSPMGGQGMNTGLQDAYNLAWKLALVVQGKADRKLLDSYETERQPVAQALLETTDRAFQLIVSDHWLAALFRTRIMAKVAAFAMGRASLRKIAWNTLSMTGIEYRASPLSHTLAGVPETAPRAGDRFPWLQLEFQGNGPSEDLYRKLGDLHFNLLVIGQPAPDVSSFGPGDLLRVHAIAADGANAAALARAGIPSRAFYLLRPDGHVALAGTQLDTAAIKQWLTAQRIDTGGAGSGAQAALKRAS